MSINRRNFLQAAAGTASLALANSNVQAASFLKRRGVNEELGIGYIGTGIRFHSRLWQAMKNGPGIAVADVDMVQLGRGLQVILEQQRKMKRSLIVKNHENYQQVLDNKDVDVVFIGSPDHWHTKQAIDAMKAGKDVYCEKPVTLTIREGEQLEQVMEQTGRIVQVGTQQRTEYGQRFAKGAAIARAGRLGKLNKVTCAIGGSRTCDPLPAVAAPKQINWDLWQGQAAEQKYRAAPQIVDVKGWGAGYPLSRTHRYYRWWYEYSGGKLTDWGAHHLDIALIGMDKLRSDIGKIKLDVELAEHGVELDANGMPTSDDRFNCATKFKVKLTFADGVVMYVVDSAMDDLGFSNGIMFEGQDGRMLVNRGKLVGAAVDQLKEKPLDDDWYFQLFQQPAPENHVDHFFDCVKKRQAPISDLKSHNLMLNICHAINIALRLNKSIEYDPATRQFNDEAANSFVSREQRKGFEITV